MLILLFPSSLRTGILHPLFSQCLMPLILLGQKFLGILPSKQSMAVASSDRALHPAEGKALWPLSFGSGWFLLLTEPLPCLFAVTAVFLTLSPLSEGTGT